MITIESIQIGHVITEGNPNSRSIQDRQWTTGFYKNPVATPVTLTPMGIEGDAVADTRAHGGIDKAILCYAASHYRDWAAEHPELKMAGGAMGENLTIRGATENGVCIGDQFKVADCVLQISQPRQPCWKIARRWGVKTLTKEVTQTGRTGWYVRVIQAGTIQKDDEMVLTNRPNSDWPIARANDVMFGREVDRMAVIELMAINELAESWKAGIA